MKQFIAGLANLSQHLRAQAADRKMGFADWF